MKEHECINSIQDFIDILENVKANGDKAVEEYTLKFDGSKIENPEITKEQLKEYAKECDSEVFQSLERAGKNIEDFHKRQLQQSWLTTFSLQSP